MDWYVVNNTYIGDITYANNIASIRVFEKNDFKLIETIIESNIESRYYQYEI